MHIYSSILDPYEPPRPARIYDNPQVVRRSLLSQLFAGFRTAAVTPLTVSTAGRPGAGANPRACTVERGDLATSEPPIVAASATASTRAMACRVASLLLKSPEAAPEQRLLRVGAPGIEPGTSRV